MNKRMHPAASWNTPNNWALTSLGAIKHTMELILMLGGPSPLFYATSGYALLWLAGVEGSAHGGLEGPVKPWLTGFGPQKHTLAQVSMAYRNSICTFKKKTMDNLAE